MNRWQRCLLGLASGVAFAVFPASGFAAGPTTTTQDCLAAGLHGGQAQISLGLAKRCAPAGAFVVKTGHGYAIKVIEGGTVVGDPCTTRSTQLIDAGITDRLDAGVCWNGSAAWTNWQQVGCYSWLPAAGCFWQSSWHSNYGWKTTADGQYAQNCAFSVPCDNGLQIDQYPNGSWDSWNWYWW